MNISGGEKSSLFEFMVQNSVYPMYSRLGKVFFRCKTRGIITPEKERDIIVTFSLESAEDCRNLRKEISERVSHLRENKPIKKWVKEERPREMLIQNGAQALSLAKLLAIILRTGNEGRSAEELGRSILNRFGSLRVLDSISVNEMCTIPGIGHAKAVQIKAALELGKRLYKESAQARKQIKSPEEVVGYASEFYGPYLRDVKKEYFHAVLLDIKNKPIENVELSKGSISATIVDPREIIKEATIRSASSVILLHNHPSGDTTPSSEDIDLTRRICHACKLVGIKVLDHIIIGGNQEDYFSFAREGLIDS